MLEVSHKRWEGSLFDGTKKDGWEVSWWSSFRSENKDVLFTNDWSVLILCGVYHVRRKWRVY